MEHLCKQKVCVLQIKLAFDGFHHNSPERIRRMTSSQSHSPVFCLNMCTILKQRAEHIFASSKKVRDAQKFKVDGRAIISRKKKLSAHNLFAYLCVADSVESETKIAFVDVLYT